MKMCRRCFRNLENNDEIVNCLCESCFEQRENKSSEVLNRLYTINLDSEIEPVSDIALTSIAFSLEKIVRFLEGGR